MQAMKPETVRRREAKRVVDRMEAKASRVERLTTLVEQHGEASIWAELLELEKAA